MVTQYRFLTWTVILFSVFSLSACESENESRLIADKADAWQLHLQPVQLEEGTPLALQETIYLPVYAHIYYTDHKKLLNLTETVSIRNTDENQSIILTSVRHYRTDGSLLKEYIDKPLLLGALATADFVVPENDTTGGTGANFIIEWVSKEKVSEPITESVMIYAGSSHSVSFLSRGVSLKREADLRFKPRPSQTKIEKVPVDSKP